VYRSDALSYEVYRSDALSYEVYRSDALSYEVYRFYQAVTSFQNAVSQSKRKNNFCTRNVPVGVTFMTYIHLINDTQRIRDHLLCGNWFQPRV